MIINTHSYLLLRVLHLGEISAKGLADVEKIDYKMSIGMEREKRE